MSSVLVDMNPRPWSYVDSYKQLLTGVMSLKTQLKQLLSIILSCSIYVGFFAQKVIFNPIIKVCGSHIKGRTINSKILRVGFYWTIMKEECSRFEKICTKCQKHGDPRVAPTKQLSIMNPCPFYK